MTASYSLPLNIHAALLHRLTSYIVSEKEFDSRKLVMEMRGIRSPRVRYLRAVG